MYKISEFLAAEKAGPIIPPTKDGYPQRKPWIYQKLAFRRLNQPLSEQQTEGFSKRILELRDKAYEQDTGQMTTAALDMCGCCINKEESLESVFCSELVSVLRPAVPGAIASLVLRLAYEAAQVGNRTFEKGLPKCRLETYG
jgi:hypothetical protein